ncbi:MAG: 3D domain-containing protein [Anaerovoracaceae bacterium]
MNLDKVLQNAAITALLMIPTGAVLGGIALTQQYSAVVSKWENSSRENMKLNVKLEELSQQIDKISVKNIELTNKVDEFKKKNEALLRENEKLKKQANSKQQKATSRGGRVDELSSYSGREYDIEVTHYCPCTKCNGKWTGQPTTSGTGYTAGKTIAVPRDLLGKKIYIEGYGVRVGQDTGSAIVWIDEGRKFRVDVFVSSHSEAMKKGRVQTKGKVLN